MPLGLEADAWLYAAAVAFVLGHLAVLGYLVRRSATASGPGVSQPVRGDASADAGGHAPADARTPEELPPVDTERVVRCPHCKVRNGAAFRFCRFCVGELTGGATVSESGGTSKDGQAF